MIRRMSVGRSPRRQLVYRPFFLAKSGFLSDDFHLHWFALLLRVLMYLHSVADVYLGRDIPLAHITFLILGHLGFSADMGRSGSDSVSSLSPVDDHSDLHNPQPKHPIPNPHYDSMMSSFVGHSDNYLFRISLHLIYFTSNLSLFP